MNGITQQDENLDSDETEAGAGLPNEPEEPLKWEEVADELQRIKVHGGWLYRATQELVLSDDDPRIGSVYRAVLSESMCFVPEFRLR